MTIRCGYWMMFGRQVPHSKHALMRCAEQGLEKFVWPRWHASCFKKDLRLVGGEKKWHNVGVVLGCVIVLDIFRSASKSWVIRGIFLMLALSFAFFGGTQDIIRNFFSDHSFVKFGDESITIDDYQTALRREIGLMEQSLGQKLSNEQRQSPHLLRDVLIKMIRQRLIEIEARRMGFMISDDELRRFVHNLPFFQKNGQFDRKTLKGWLSEQGQKEHQWLEFVRRELLRSSFLYAIHYPHPFVSQDFVDFYTHTLLGKRQAVYARIPYDNPHWAAPETTSDDALKDVMKDQPELFTEPERRSGFMVVLDPQALERGDVEDLTIEIEQRLDRGENWQEWAKTQNGLEVIEIQNIEAQGSSPEKNFQTWKKEGLTMPLVDLFFQTPEGQVSESFKRDDHKIAWVRVDAISPQHPMAFEKVKQDVLKVWQQRYREKQAALWVETLTSDNFESACQKIEIKPESRSFSRPESILWGLVSEEQGLGQEAQDLAEKIFKNDAGKIVSHPGSDAVHVCVVQKGITESPVTPDVTEKIRKFLQGKQTQDFFEAYIQHLVKTHKIQPSKKAQMILQAG